MIERLSSVKYGESGVAEQVVEMSGRQDIRSSVPYFQTNVTLEIRCEPNRALVAGEWGLAYDAGKEKFHANPNFFTLVRCPAGPRGARQSSAVRPNPVPGWTRAVRKLLGTGPS